MTCTLCAFHVDAMAVPPAKRSFAEAIVSASDAIDAMGKLIDDTDGKYTDADMKKDVKLVLRELHSFRKGVPPDRGDAREGTRTATAKSYHKIVSGPQKYDMTQPLGEWQTIGAARAALLKTCGAWTSAVSGLRIGDGRKMSYHVLAGEEDGSVKQGCLVKMDNNAGKAYIYWFKEAEEEPPETWVRIPCAFEPHAYACQPHS